MNLPWYKRIKFDLIRPDPERKKTDGGTCELTNLK